MQPNPENRFSRQLAIQLVQLSRERGIFFTQNSERLIILAAEAWLEDPIPSNREIPQENRASLALQIFASALEDQHITDDIKKSGEVSFGSLLVSLSDAGKRIIGKGF